MTCPCGKGENLEECCGRFIRKGELPSTAQELMRSRYTAHVLRDIDYLINTHDPSTRTPDLAANARDWAQQASWLGLEITELIDGNPSDNEGVVEFRARYMVGETQHEHAERSVFHKRQGRWYYVSGTRSGARPAARSAPKLGRNDPCSCGSGKKYKKCCGAV